MNSKFYYKFQPAKKKFKGECSTKSCENFQNEESDEDEEKLVGYLSVIIQLGQISLINIGKSFTRSYNVFIADINLLYRFFKSVLLKKTFH